MTDNKRLIELTEIILSDAKENAGYILDKANKEKETILLEAKEAVKARTAEAEKNAEAKKADLIERAKSSALLDKRKALLSAKQDIIGSITEKAKNSLLALPTDKYFEVLLKLCAKYSEDAEGTVLLSAKDLARLPGDFEARLGEAAKGKLTVGKEPAKIDGGFLLIYDGIDMNCSFEALFEEKAEAMQDAVSRIIFE